MLSKIGITSLERIHVEGGDVCHALKNFDLGYKGFGEAYFSWVQQDYTKAWKRHLRMTMNLIVPVGNVKFVFLTNEGTLFHEEVIGEDNYVRITVPPGIWFGFRGEYSPKSLILNLASIVHEPNEVERLPLNAFKYKFI